MTHLDATRSMEAIGSKVAAPQSLSTSSVPPHERFAYWLDMICTVYVQLNCASPRDLGFFGNIDFGALGPLRLTRLSSSAQRIWRPLSDIRRETEDYFLVQVQRTGRGVVCQDERQAVLEPGDFAIYDCTRPYELHFDGSHHDVSVLRVPRTCLENAVGSVNELTATTVHRQSTPASLLLSMLDPLHANIANVHPSAAGSMSDSVVSIVAAGLRSLPSANARRPSNLQAYHLERAKAYVRNHLREPGLTVNGIAEALSVSPGHLHRLFQNEPLPLSKLIWKMRLEGCQRDLADVRYRERGICDIAFSWGFSDVTHFSRCFREHFGMPPREWRLCNDIDRKSALVAS